MLLGEHAHGEALSAAFAGPGQHQDTGAKMIHSAPYTTSSIVSKSISRGGGRSSYRGLVQIEENAHRSKSSVVCDALLVDDISRTDTYPYVDVRTDDVEMGHEATVSKVSEDQLFYLEQRGANRAGSHGHGCPRIRGADRPSSCPWSTHLNSTGLSSFRWKEASAK